MAPQSILSIVISSLNVGIKIFQFDYQKIASADKINVLIA